MRALVTVDSDLEVPNELDNIRVVVRGAGVDSEAVATLGGDGDAPLPRTLELRAEQVTGPYSLLVQARRGDLVVLETETAVSFIPGQTVAVRLDLARGCVDVTCPAGERCVDGECEVVSVDAGAADGGIADGGVADAGEVDSGSAGEDAGPPSEDAGPPGVDAGPPGADAGAPDAGPPGMDAGACGPAACASPCTCTGGCPCEVACPPDGCEATCEGLGTTCSIDANRANNVGTLLCRDGAICDIDAMQASNAEQLRCESNAQCTIDCRSVSNCFTRCTGGASCAVRCNGASNCRFDECAGVEQSCPGQWITCNAPCP